MTTTTFAERLKQAVAQRERELGERILKKEIAAAAGVTSSAVTLWFKGTTHDLKADPILRLAKFLRVRVEWLKDARGPMKGDSAAQLELIAPDEIHRTSPLSKDAQAVIELIMKGDRDGALTKETLRALRVLITATPAQHAASANTLREAHAIAEQQIAAKQPRPKKKKTVA
ncbi:hypothetical protein Q8F57_003360 [Paraburkholderia terrae]|uniref:hypothetical protein n=1 Tax=Paraburkholderia terrae TaxID=311230 RepID=UPI00296AFCBA|nr:hypothetical protein [Paraburkholderia terrae]MDW3655436.1 hypothetical protein [Paraburkholderia terrae]